jgi:hypothetical protein
MLKYSKNTYLKEKYFVKENEMFWNIYVFKMESSKINSLFNRSVKSPKVVWQLSEDFSHPVFPSGHIIVALN